MAFHVACPITCKRICYCLLGFPTKLQSKRGKSQFEDEISRIQDFLKDPWLFRVRDDATVDVAVPKLPSPKQLVPVDVPAVEEVEVEVEDVVETKMIPVSSLVVEDFVPPVEAGALMVQDAPQDTIVEHGQLNANVNVTCQLCFSGENGGSERAKKMLPCRECGKKYHRNCLKTWSQHRDLFHWSSWACPTCRVCEVCRRHGDSNKFKFCKRCDGAFHCYCMQPPHKYVSSGPYLCSKHTKCHSCASNVPGNGHCVRWFLGYTCCDACGRLFTKGKYCPVCLKVYRDSEATPMVCCDICQRWVHLQCDGISEQRYMQFQVDRNLPYTCPTCRGECYQVRDLDDAIQELWRRKDEEDRDLITSLRAAAGLPTQDDIFSISPFSDDEDDGQIARSAKFSYKSIADCSPKKSKESVKKISSKKYAKKKGHMVSLDSKNENFPEDHHDPQSLGFARSKEDRFHPDGPDLLLSPIAINSSSSDRNGPIKEQGVLNHKFVDEVTGINVDRAAILPFKAKNVSDAIISEDGGKVTSKPKLMKGTKLVIHLGGRNKTIANSPRSDSSSIPREQELMTLRAGGNEAVSRHRMGEHLAERLDGAANSDDGYRVDSPNQTEVVKPRERNIIKLGKGKLGASGSNAMPARGNGLPSSESAHPMLSKRHNDQSTAAEGRQNSVSKADKVSLRRHPENKIDITGGSNISRKPVLSSPDSSLRPSLRLKFKNPLLASLAPIGDEGKGFVNKGRRSKRKRPSHLMEKPKPQEEDNVITPHDDSLENEILDSNWILKKLGRDAIGKRVKVHQPSDNSWHNGVVNDVVEGTSLLSIHLDNGRAKILELGKQGIRIVPQKQKRL